MKKEYSLKDKRLFEKTINSKRRILTDGLTIFYQNSEKFKVGISVPKKQGNSVYRNKNKRIIKNIINQIKPYHYIDKNIVIIAKDNFNKKDFQQKKEILEKIFNRLKDDE